MKALLPLSCILALSLAFAAPAHACKCMLQSVEQAREQATAIFEGRVTNIEDVPLPGMEGLSQKRVSFAVVRVWKELEDAETVTATTQASTASCGYPFEAGQSYLVYAGKGERGYTVSACSRTKPLSEASEDLAALGGGITPVSVKPAEPKPAAKPKAAAKRGGCASTGGGQGRASVLWLGLPVVALTLRRRRA